jgi:hypothetical protein
MGKMTMFRFACLTAIALLPAGLIVSGGAGVQLAHAGPEYARCEIRISKRNGGTTLEGFVIAQQPVSGSYRISVTTAGGSGADVDQSGAFQATPGQPVSLGAVHVGAGGYSADLTVKWVGGSTKCKV